MSAYRPGKANWYDPRFYPVEGRLPRRLEPQEQRDHPRRRRREEVIANIQDKDKLPFESQAHDVFTREPIKGVRAYWLHSSLHDWNGEEAIKILQILKPASKPG